MSTESNDIQEIIDFPLSDGTFAKVTAQGSYSLEHRFGVTRGRLKRGRGGDSVVVKPRRAFGKPTTTAKELPLRDLLAYIYNVMPSSAFSEPGQTLFLIDGDPRNLLPENIGLTALPEIETECSDEAPRIACAPAPAAPAAPRSPDAMSIPAQEELLAELFPKLKAISGAFLNPESPAQADECAQDTVLELLHQIRAGRCRAVNKNMFRAYATNGIRKKALSKLSALVSGACLDIDHDRVAVRLLRVARESARLRKKQGLPFDSPVRVLPNCMTTVEIARELEKKAELDRARIAEEGGEWGNVDLESATELNSTTE